MENLYRQFKAHKELMKIARKLNKLDCASCNGEIGENDYLLRADKLECYANSLACAFDLNAYHQTDPRGASLYLVTNEQNNQLHYNEGICIY